MFWITLGIGIMIGLALGVFSCNLVMEKSLVLSNDKDSE